jgi:hypothetical protein
MLRVGSAGSEVEIDDAEAQVPYLPALAKVRLDATGELVTGLEPENKDGAVPGVPIPGAYLSLES